MLQNSKTKSLELWINKKNVFVKSILLLQRCWDSSDFKMLEGQKPHIKINNLPTALEVNEVLAQLYVLSADEKIPNEFKSVLTMEASPASISKYILLVREELADLSIDIKPKINLDPQKEMILFYNTDPVS